MCRFFAATVLLLAGMAWPASARAQDQAAVAVVDGRPLNRKDFQKVLVDAYGADVLQQMILLELARGESARRGITVSPAEVQAEFIATRERIVSESGMTADEATEENKDAALQIVLGQRRVSLPEFMLGMERNVHLRKCVESDLKDISEATLREEFARTYGERVRVRHIQIPVRDVDRVTRVQEMLKRGAAFGDVARELSVHPDTGPRGGEMPPFTFDDPEVDPLIREAAFSLNVGEISSAIKTDRFLHILKLEERLTPPNAKFEDVRPQVEASLRERVIPQKMSDLAGELYRKAQIRVLDGDLKKSWEAGPGRK
jgi:parvulin-like peptidyl-prolyl isomerase